MELIYVDGIYVGSMEEIRKEAEKLIDVMSEDGFNLIQAEYILKEVDKMINNLPRALKIMDLQKMR